MFSMFKQLMAFEFSVWGPDHVYIQAKLLDFIFYVNAIEQLMTVAIYRTC